MNKHLSFFYSLLIVSSIPSFLFGMVYKPDAPSIVITPVITNYQPTPKDLDQYPQSNIKIRITSQKKMNIDIINGQELSFRTKSNIGITDFPKTFPQLIVYEALKFGKFNVNNKDHITALEIHFNTHINNQCTDPLIQLFTKCYEYKEPIHINDFTAKNISNFLKKNIPINQKQEAEIKKYIKKLDKQ